MDNVSFQSRISFVTNKNFDKKVYSFGKTNCVGHPWTLKESIVSNNLYTRNVSSCSTCVITNGEKALMMHICPSNDNIQNFSEIDSFIKKNFEDKLDNLKAFLVGAMDFDKSLDLNKKFKNFLTNNNIPFTHLSKGTALGVDIAYSLSDDELILSSFVYDEDDKKLTSKDLVNKFFKECSLSKLDEIV